MRSYSDKKNSKGLEINILAFFKELSRKLWVVLVFFIIGAVIGGVVGGYIGAYRGRSIVAAVASGGVMLLPIVLISLFISGNGGAFGILLPLCGLAAGIAAGCFVALKRRSNAGRSIKRAMKRR